MIDYSRYSPGRTAQADQLPGRDMVKNQAGGYVFALDKWKVLDRFLVMGTEGGTYYVNEPKLTKEAVHVLYQCLAEDANRVIEQAAEISVARRGKSNDPCLFALAAATAHQDVEVRRHALLRLPDVARIGTHLFHFAAYVEEFRGWGRGLRRAVGEWYNDQNADELARQLVKYQQRDGWSHRDLLRLAHPKAPTRAHEALYDHVCRPTEIFDADLPVHYVQAKSVSDDEVLAADAISGYALPREAIPSELLSKPAVWEALLDKMPITATVRNLNKMTMVGLLAPGGNATKLVVERLAEPKGIHPLQLLTALRTYASGQGFKGKLTWTPVADVIDALDTAFEESFQYVDPVGKSVLVGVDVSASMLAECAGLPGVSCAEAAAAVAMIYARREKKVELMAFGNTFVRFPVSKKSRLDDVMKLAKGISFGATDCSIPMQYALQNQRKVDLFVVLSDGQTWAGRQHPSEALETYRKKTGRKAKFAEFCLFAHGTTMADPWDANSQAFIGLDAQALNIAKEFVNE